MYNKSPTERLRLSEGRDPKPCLGTRTQRVLLAPCPDCGGAGIHRARCGKFQTAEGNGFRAQAAKGYGVAMDAMREAAGVVG